MMDGGMHGLGATPRATCRTHAALSFANGFSAWRPDSDEASRSPRSRFGSWLAYGAGDRPCGRQAQHFCQDRRRRPVTLGGDGIPPTGPASARAHHSVRSARSGPGVTGRHRPKANRFPTVAELYQTTAVGTTLVPQSQSAARAGALRRTRHHPQLHGWQSAAVVLQRRHAQHADLADQHRPRHHDDHVLRHQCRPGPQPRGRNLRASLGYAPSM